MLQLIVDILHLIVAGAMSFIGIEYSRAPECDPVQVEPAAYYELTQLPSAGEVYRLAPAAPQALQTTVSDCGSQPAPVSLPRVRAHIRA